MVTNGSDGPVVLGKGMVWSGKAEQREAPAQLVLVMSPMGMPAQLSWLTGALHRSQSHLRSTSAWSWQDLGGIRVLAAPHSSLQEV